MPVAGTISRTRFFELQRYLHFADDSTLSPPGNPGYDRLGKLSPLLLCFLINLQLGAALGSLDFIEEYVGTEVKGWIEEIENLAANLRLYAVFFHGTRKKRTYLCRTIPGCSPLLQPLEDVIRQKLVVSITG